jgi:hypothetical protein
VAHPLRSDDGRECWWWAQTGGTRWCLLGRGERLESAVTSPTPAESCPIPQTGLWVAGHSRVETIRDSFSAPEQLPGRPRPCRARRRDPLAIARRRSPVRNGCRAGPSCRRRVGLRPEGLGRVSVATLHNVGEVLRLSVGPGPRPTRAEVATQPVRPRSPLHSVLGVRSRIQARRCQPAGGRALWHRARPPSPARVIEPGRH